MKEETVDLEEDEESDRDESSKYSIFQIKYYQTLFNVTTTDVLDRVFRAVVPFRMTFFDAIKENPDLYGPFWITCSLVFIMAASGNFANYLAYLLAGQEDKWVYDFNKLPYGAAVIFIYMIVIPLSYWGVLAWIGEFGVKLIQMYCLYGYAMFIYLIAGVCTQIFYLLDNMTYTYLTDNLCCTKRYCKMGYCFHSMCHIYHPPCIILMAQVVSSQSSWCCYIDSFCAVTCGSCFIFHFVFLQL